MAVQSLYWRDRKLYILDQTLLPGANEVIELPSLEAVWEAIRSLRVRGAPAIGVCAAFGVVVAALDKRPGTAAAVREAAKAAADRLAEARPTAVNLFWALDRMRRAAEEAGALDNKEAALQHLEFEAEVICAEDAALCRGIGAAGAPLIPEGAGVLTHCNAGALATAGSGTALAVLTAARAQGRRFHVYACETRPLFQGARLTAWEMVQAGIEVTVLCDSAAAHLMREGRVHLVITGADRIAANGDCANKIGTYALAVLARAHRMPFYVAAPYSTFDPACPHGGRIDIEERDPREVTEPLGRRTVPDGAKAYNPAFDVTPAEYISGFITERGLLLPPFAPGISQMHGAGTALSAR